MKQSFAFFVRRSDTKVRPKHVDPPRVIEKADIFAIELHDPLVYASAFAPSSYGSKLEQQREEFTHARRWLA